MTSDAHASDCANSSVSASISSGSVLQLHSFAADGQASIIKGSAKSSCAPAASVGPHHLNPQADLDSRGTQPRSS
ncbi:hypothetical protein SUGI_0858520 [Cryptomeria japonica]|nr:hypothetical protein SUGI_0858520 [Cryptomeria japonica]